MTAENPLLPPVAAAEYGESDRRQAASDVTQSIRGAAVDALPWHDDADFVNVQRGFLGTVSEAIEDEHGNAVLDLPRYAFLDEDSPSTVHPSLWRLAQLNGHHGLFTVCDGVYQVRNFDISNLTVILGETGFIVVDPLYSRETAAAAMRLVRDHLGDRPVTAVIYTHSHLDHFGGVLGVLSHAEAIERKVPIIAPAEFMEHAVNENLYTGVIEGRRNQFMFGTVLPRDSRGHVTSSLGIANSTGVSTLLAPTVSIGVEGAVMVLDGIEVEFINASGAEAPSELHFVLPALRAACLAENLTRVMHNIYTLRGAQVRDALLWSKLIDRTIDQLATRVDAVFMGHHWPVWGSAEIEAFLHKQRDLYRFMHDETLRYMNQGFTAGEIAEILELPEALAAYWPNRGTYGSLSHNVKAIYQRYLGWFDGNPANLNPLPPKRAAVNYVSAMGGIDRVIELATRAFADGDYRWTSELLKHAVSAHPDRADARELQARSFEQLGYQSEASPWRNFYLSGAQELRGTERTQGMSAAHRSRELVRAMSPEQLLDYLGIRFNGSAHHDLVGIIHFVVAGTLNVVTVGNGCIATRKHTRAGEAPSSSLELDHDVFAQLCQGALSIDEVIERSAASVTGDVDWLRRFWSALDSFDGGFALTEPRV